MTIWERRSLSLFFYSVIITLDTMNETFSAQSSKQATSTNQSLIPQDSWIVRRDSAELFKEYQTAQTNLNSAGPGTSHEEWNKLRMATGRTLRALQEGDKYGWEALISGGRKHDLIKVGLSRY